MFVLPTVTRPASVSRATRSLVSSAVKRANVVPVNHSWCVQRGSNSGLLVMATNSGMSPTRLSQRA